MKHKRLRTLTMVVSFGVMIATYGSIKILGQWIRIGINSSDSIPGKVFLILKGVKLQKYDMVAFHPPKNPYYKTWFVKYIAGVAGDLVVSSGSSFYINGKFIGKVKDYARDGSLLNPSAPGVVREGHFFVWTPHRDSYDSRYQDIGLIPFDRIIGRAIRIL